MADEEFEEIEVDEEEPVEEDAEYIEDDDFLDEEGICYFPAEVVSKPVQIRLASPYIGITDLIKGLIVIGKNGPEQVPYDTGAKKIIGAVKDMETIEWLQNTYGGRGLLFASPENPTQMLTVEEWERKYGTDPIALMMMMRLWWNSTGGGVRTSR